MYAEPAGRGVGGDAVVLENGFLRATIEPGKGAQIRSFVILPEGIETLKEPALADFYLLPGRRTQSLGNLRFEPVKGEDDSRGDPAGAFSAQSPPQMPMDDKWRSAQLGGGPWNAVIAGGKAILHSESLENLVLTRRFFLSGGEAALRMEYEARNTGKTPVTFCLGSRLALGAWTKDSVLCVPSRGGVLQFHLPLNAKDASKMPILSRRGVAWIYDLPAAWTATVDAAGNGVAVWFDPRHASFLKVDTRSGAVELGRTRVTVAPGEAFRTTAIMSVVRGMRAVHGAGAGILAGFRLTPAAADGSPALVRKSVFDEARDQLKSAGPSLDAAVGETASPEDLVKELTGEVVSKYTGPAIGVDMNLMSARDRQAEVALSLRRLPDGKWQSLGRRNMRLAGGVPAPLKLPLKPDRRGTYVLRADVLEKGKAVSRFEHPVIAGAASGIFEPPASPREGAINDEYLYAQMKRAGFPIRGDWQPSMRVKTSHVKYAKPLSGGPLKILAVAPYWSVREVVELAQRLDVDVDTVAMGKCGYRKKFTLYYDVTMAEAPYDEIDMLRKFLARPHDVIVLYNMYGDWFPVDLMAEMQRQVEEDGRGVVMVFPDHSVGPMGELSRQAKKQERFFALTKARTGNAGGGRVAIFDGEMGYTHNPYFRSEAEHEDLARMVLWAARGEPPVVVVGGRRRRTVARSDLANLGGKPVALTLHNPTGEAFEGKLRVVPRRDLVRSYPFYATVPMGYRSYDTCEDAAPAWEKPISLPAGARRRVDVPVPPLPASEYSLDVFAVDDKGGVVCWDRVPVRVSAALRVAEVAVETPDGGKARFVTGQKAPLFAAKPEQTLKVTCTLAGAAGADSVRLQGIDLWGRIVIDTASPVEWQRDGGKAVLAAPLAPCRHRVLILRAVVRRGEEALAEQRWRIFVHAWPDAEPGFKLRGYADVKVNPREAGWNVRVGGGSPGLLAWFNIMQTAYGGWIPGAEKLISPFDEKIEAPTDLTKMLDEGMSGKQPAMDDDLKNLLAGTKGGKKGVDLTQGWIRVPCLNDPAWREKAIGAVERDYRNRSFFGPFRGFSVDEWFYYKERTGPDSWRRSFAPGRHTNICRCEHCLRRFRGYAKDIFNNDLALLNRTWNTEFETWDEVNPPIIDPRAKQGPLSSMWPYILDHRHFIDRQLPGVLGEARERIEAIDPGCQTGISGMWPTGLWNGLDIYLLAEHCKFNMLYSDLDIWLSFGSGGGCQWCGYSAKYNPHREAAAAWTHLFRGMVAVGYYGKFITPMTRGDHTYLEGPMGMFESIRGIQNRGFGKLLVGHQKVDPIALYYSPRDIYLAGLEEWAEDHKKFVARWRNAGRSHREFPWQAANSYRGLLASRYLNPFWIAYGHLEKGGLGRWGVPKVLLLPYAQCLSDRQAATLEKYVREGGVLVGDVQTGIRDGHGALRKRGVLDQVFGIERSGPWRMRVRADRDGTPVPVRFGKDFGEPFTMAFDAVDPAPIKAKGARPLAGFRLNGAAHPAFLVHKYGKGTAIYLNFLPSGYRTVRSAGVGAEVTVVEEAPEETRAKFDRIFARILDIAGVERPLDLGEGMRCRVYRFGEDPVSYVGLLTSYRNAWKDDLVTEVLLPAKGHVYDARDGKYVGFADRFKVRFRPEAWRTALLYSVLPYRVEGVEIRPAKARVKAGEPLLFTARVRSDPEAGTGARRHVLSVRAINPEGETPAWYRSRLETRNGSASGRVDPAFNDPRGTWTLIATDAATGVEGRAEFVVE